jgi:chromosome segregation ATPase
MTSEDVGRMKAKIENLEGADKEKDVRIRELENEVNNLKNEQSSIKAELKNIVRNQEQSRVETKEGLDKISEENKDGITKLQESIEESKSQTFKFMVTIVVLTIGSLITLFVGKVF